MQRLSKYLKQGLIIAVLITIVDQISKWWVVSVYDLPAKGSVELLPFLNFTMVWNKGISMGLFSAENDTGRWLLVAGTGLIMVVIAVWLSRSQRRLEAVALATVLGGALGNVIDRIQYGAVADFIHLYAFDYHFYVFNVADAAISLGVAALIFDSFRSQDLQDTNKSTTTTTET